MPDPVISPLAGKRATEKMLVDLAHPEREFYKRKPDTADPAQLVAFGTSGHRGSSLRGTFTEAHILAITQAICDYRAIKGTDGPLFMGKDTHALSAPARKAAMERLSPEMITAGELAGERIIAKLSAAQGNNAPRGLKVVAEGGWFAVRPSEQRTYTSSMQRASGMKSIC